MKKILTALLAGTMALTMLAGCGSKPAENNGAQGDANNNAAASGETLRMGTNATFPPYEFYGDNGTDIVGIDADIAKAIADKLGMTLEIVDQDFDSLPAALEAGSIDIAAAGMTVTPDRQTQMDFSKSYATGVQVVIVPENSDIKSIDDLTGKLIGVQQGTTGDIYCAADPADGGYGEDAVRRFNSGPLAVEALKNGQVDCVVIDQEPAKNYVAANAGLSILDTEFAVEDYAIGIKKGNTELLDKVNSALQELKADGTIDQIIGTYIKAE